MNRLLPFVALTLCLLLMLPGCQSSKRHTAPKAGSPLPEVTRLLDEGRVDDAARRVASEDAFFSSYYGDPEVREVADRLAAALSVQYSPQLEALTADIEALPWPVEQPKWSKTRRALVKFHKDLDAFTEITPFEYRLYRPAAYSEAVTALKHKEAQIRTDASARFAEYPLIAKKSFFTVYPVPVDGGAVMQDDRTRWEPAIRAFSDDEADAFFMAYGPYLPESAKEILGKKYFDTLCPNPATAELKTILAAYEQCKEAELPVKQIPGVKVAFLQVTSPDLIKNKTLDFPLSIKVDVPFEARKASMIKMFSHDAVKEADIVVLVNVSIARARRVVERSTRVPSTYVASYTQVANPEYDIVQNELKAATQEYHAIVSGNSYTWPAALVEKFVVRDNKVERMNAAQVRMNDLKEQLRSTAKFNKKPDYQPYMVTKAFMDLYKYATVNYYVIDKRNRRYFRDTFDYQDKAFFTICYDIHQLDRDRDRLLQTAVLEEDVVRYELEPVVVNLSDLLEQYVSTPSEWVEYETLETLHRSVAADVTRAQQKFAESDFKYDRYHDRRFDSVVVVRNIGRGIGSGFYVTDELVLTNYHVVNENEYVRLKLFNEREVMGRVVARDAHLDLALIEADVKGRPVCFYNKRTLPLGVPLEVIGHPNGLQFSITRGALSSVRKERSINYLKGSEKVLFIQTDAAVNGGNSGGPMFYGNYVVGVSDWGFKRLSNGRTAQGLNFGIHYSEVFKFFERNGIEICKGSK